MPGIIGRLSTPLSARAREALPPNVMETLDRGQMRLPSEVWSGLTRAQRNIVTDIQQQVDSFSQTTNTPQGPAIRAPAGTHVATESDPVSSSSRVGPNPSTGNDPRAMRELFGNVVNTDGLDALQGQPLLDELRNRFYSRHVSLSYEAAREEMFGSIDNEGGVVDSVYTEREVRTQDIPDANGANGFNTEHTWPQSQLKEAGKDDAVSDLHHLYPTDTEANGKRSNYPFGVPTTVTWSKDGSELGRDAEGRIVFRPPAEHRGDVARAMFWIATAYNLDIPAYEEAVLRQWHDEDPVSQAERTRHDEIAEVQHDQNPFVVLDPSLPDRIDNF
jgi:deoxyribonuclease I